MDAAVELDELRQRTRAAQHATSYPLLVIGVLFVNYGVVGFASTPIAWRFAGALAFVGLWLLGKANEYVTGVGRGRGDYLAIACGVFVATQLTLLTWIVGASWARQPHVLEGIWVVIIGGGLVAGGLSTRTPAHVSWGIVTAACGLAVAVIGYQAWTYRELAPFPSAGGIGYTAVQQPLIVTSLGVVLTVAGSVVFSRERRLS
jgi:hypothetical protein